MKKTIALFTLLTIFSEHLSAQKSDPKLLGNCLLKQLEKEPYATWYAKNFVAYEPNSEIVNAIKKINLSNYSVKIFFGSWCGDSKRELPKMAKLLEKLSFPTKNLTLIGVDDSTEVYKQSPQREEAGLNIFRVPTFIFYENNKEVGRMVEYAKETMERDLLQIFSKKEYIPNYFTYPVIVKWMKEGLLKDENISARGLASQLLKLTNNESELNACGYALMASGNTKEAVTVFRINANLFPQSANCYDSLGEAYAKVGLKDKAIQAYETASQLDPKNEDIQERLKKLKAG
ncbi:MAG: thioredoxin family protein [Cyclobacteriaceae bacterium]